MSKRITVLGLLTVFLFALVSTSRAEETASADKNDAACLDCRSEDGFIRAGCPQCVAWYARPVYMPYYVGYYVGGGAAYRGEPRCINEGTWGRDFGGILFPKRVCLGYWHGRRVQSGGGAYKTDGPHLHHHE